MDSIVIDKSDRTLKKCRRLMRIARKNLADLQSPTIDDMPKGSTYGNPTEERVINQASALKELSEIYEAMSWLGKDERELLITKYFDFDSPSDKVVYGLLNMSERQYYRVKSQALLHFAEAYNNGRLFYEC